jgi:hypothetical protein
MLHFFRLTFVCKCFLFKMKKAEPQKRLKNSMPLRKYFASSLTDAIFPSCLQMRISHTSFLSNKNFRLLIVQNFLCSQNICGPSYLAALSHLPDEMCLKGDNII